MQGNVHQNNRTRNVFFFICYLRDQFWSIFCLSFFTSVSACHRNGPSSCSRLTTARLIIRRNTHLVNFRNVHQTHVSNESKTNDNFKNNHWCFNDETLIVITFFRPDRKTLQFFFFALQLEDMKYESIVKIWQYSENMICFPDHIMMMLIVSTKS